MTREEEIVAATAFIAALVEGVRLLGGRRGIDENRLYESVSRLADRKAFNMVVEELILQKTFRRDTNCIVYCGPCMTKEDRP